MINAAVSGALRSTGGNQRRIAVALDWGSIVPVINTPTSSRCSE